MLILMPLPKKMQTQLSCTDNDSSVPKDAPDSKEIKTGASEGQPLTSPMETSNTEDTK